MNDDGLVIQQLELGPMMNFVYLIGCAETRAAAVVDPAWDVPGIVRAVRKLDLDLQLILLTHAHPDHANGLEELLEATNASVCLQAEEIQYVREMAERFQISVDFMKRRPGNIRSVSDNEEIQMGRITVRCLHTPGHTPGSQCFLVGKNLFSGDTLFIDACGRVDLPGGDPEKMWWSLNRKLNTLEDDVVLYPGHHYGRRLISTLGEQKRSNPYMRFDSAEEFANAMGSDL
jgi:hydroxyacylglutathione hydrolase